MKRRLLNFSSASMILLVGLFFSGCYTQLAKPGSERVEEDYYEDEYVESDYDYEYEDDEEYVEDYDEYYGDEDEVLVYDQYGYNYLEPYYYYDPFFDPFFYDQYRPYSRNVSVHIGFGDPFFYAGYHSPYYYDPFFYDPFYYNPFYSSSIYIGYGWGHGYGYWGSGYYNNYYYGSPYRTNYVRTKTISDKKRNFGHRGGREDDFGYDRGSRIVSRGSGTVSGSSAVVAKPVSRRQPVKTVSGEKKEVRSPRTITKSKTRRSKVVRKRRVEPDSKSITKRGSRSSKSVRLERVQPRKVRRSDRPRNVVVQPSNRRSPQVQTQSKNSKKPTAPAIKSTRSSGKPRVSTPSRSSSSRGTSVRSGNSTGRSSSSGRSSRSNSSSRKSSSNNRRSGRR